MDRQITTMKSQPQPQSQTTTLQRSIHEFVDEIVSYCEEPLKWPLEQKDQVAFIREVVFQAKVLQKTQQYQAEAAAITAEDLAKAS